VLFNKDKTTLIQYPAQKPGASYTIPASVSSIDDEAFYGCTSLTSVVISSSVTSIGGWTFASCTALTRVDIPDSVTYIGEAAFYGLPDTAILYVPNQAIKDLASGKGVPDERIIIGEPPTPTPTPPDTSPSPSTTPSPTPTPTPSPTPPGGGTSQNNDPTPPGDNTTTTTEKTLKVKTQPTSKTVKQKESVVLKAVLTGGAGVLKYQWYSNAKSKTSGGTKIKGATRASYKPPTGKKGTRYYYCVVTSGRKKLTTKAAKVKVN